MSIENGTSLDISQIFYLYRGASTYQESKKTVVVWPIFERQLVETEIQENRQWKLIIDGEIACVWGYHLLATNKFGRNVTKMPLFIYIELQPKLNMGLYKKALVAFYTNP